ncbi:MAG: hypothetical protein JRH01_21540 [Deltaproteobacteria bacterium]|nr:hypothetical protein [Deltaproteobacteria bacterium]MBW2394452.1 hypothetical protein [Deltaproteobacteria bacterium]
MLPLLYPNPMTRDALLEDAQTAPIPELHRELFRFAEQFVRGSWNTNRSDLGRLRAAGLEDRDIVHWATLGSTQSWFTMSADGGGVPLDGNAITGPAVGRKREAYGATPERLGPPIAALESDRRDDEIAMVGLDETSDAYHETANWATKHYGFVPNLLRAVSLQPGFYRRHRLALELLEAPQSKSLEPRHHAMVRALVSHLNRSAYHEATARELLDRAGAEEGVFDQLRDDPLGMDWSPVDRAVLAFATKIGLNAYKVTEKDASSLREVGLDDEAYVDILNTVSIQTSLDRLANTLGVRPDSAPLLPQS